MDGAVTGVTLASGDTIAARAVVSSADPKRTLLGLLDPMHLGPEIVRRIQNIRAHGTLATISYAVSSLPRINGVDTLHGAERSAALSGRIRLAPASTASSARSTPRSTAASPPSRGSS